MSGSTSPVRVSRRGAQRLLAHHPWVYRSDTLELPELPGIHPVFDRKRPLGWALVNPRSEITIRVFHFGKLENPVTTLRQNLRTAVERRRLLLKASPRGAFRLVHAEADHLPGLVVDIYAGHISLQCGSAVLEPLLPVFCDDLVALLSPAGIVARNEQKSRVKEGLPLETRVLQGDIPDEVEFEEDGISFCVSLLKGQKTGGYVDQRDNHIALRRLLEGRPPMASALDIFSYQGGFAMHLGRVADRVLAVDSSADALVNLTRNAALNGIETIDTVEANAFDWLKAESQSARRHGCIVLDPPAFAKRASEVLRAASAYKEINLRAMKVLAPGGILATSTCSQHIDDAMFLDILREASVDARQEFRLIERRGQGADHPVLLTVPETRYLSCMFLEMVS